MVDWSLSMSMDDDTDDVVDGVDGIDDVAARANVTMGC